MDKFCNLELNLYQMIFLAFVVSFSAVSGAEGIEGKLRKRFETNGRTFADWKTTKELPHGFSLESYRAAEQAFQLTLDSSGVDPALTLDLYEGGNIYRTRTLLSLVEVTETAQDISLSINLPEIDLGVEFKPFRSRVNISIPNKDKVSSVAIWAGPVHDIILGWPADARHIKELDSVRDKRLIDFLNGRYSSADTLDMATLVRQRVQPKNQWLVPQSKAFLEEEHSLAEKDAIAHLVGRLRNIEGIFSNAMDSSRPRTDAYYRLSLEERQGETYFVIEQRAGDAVFRLFEASLRTLLPNLHGGNEGNHLLTLSMDQSVQTFGNTRGEKQVFVNTYAPYRVLTFIYGKKGGAKLCETLLRAR